MFQNSVPVWKVVNLLGHPTSGLDACLEQEIDQVEVAASMGIPLFSTLHMKSNGCRQRIRTGVLAGGVPSSVVRGKGLMGDDAMREGPTSKVGVVFERHDEDDEDSSWTTNFFYLPRSHTIPKVVRSFLISLIG